MSTDEDFLEIPGLTGYRVNHCGRVQSDHVRGSKFNRRSGVWFDLAIGSHKKLGHCFVNIKGRKYYIHRLVLTLFRGPCPDGLQCLHGDGNPANNHIDNLRWGTPLENAQDALRHGTVPCGEKHCRAKVSEADVRSMRAMHAKGMSIGAISRHFELRHQMVSNIVAGKRWKHSYQEQVR